MPWSGGSGRGGYGGEEGGQQYCKLKVRLAAKVADTEKCSMFKYRNGSLREKTIKFKMSKAQTKKPPTPQKTRMAVNQDGNIAPFKNMELDTAAIRLDLLQVAVMWDFDPDTESWIQTPIMVYFPKGRDLFGGIRVAVKVILIKDRDQVLKTAVDEIQNCPERLEKNTYYYTGHCALYVAKKYRQKQPAKVHFDELLTQAVADAYGQKFNRAEHSLGCKKLPKVAILPVSVMKINESGLFYNIEPFLPGKYQKFNDNYNYVHQSTHFDFKAEKNRDMDPKARRRILRSKQFSQLAQAFSHFTYEMSKGKCIVVDVQGVGSYYTDAQIHTQDGKGFGLGNLGQRGIWGFRDAHTCTKVCRKLQLPPISLRHNSNNSDPARTKTPAKKCPKPQIYEPEREGMDVSGWEPQAQENSVR